MKRSGKQVYYVLDLEGISKAFILIGMTMKKIVILDQYQFIIIVRYILFERRADGVSFCACHRWDCRLLTLLLAWALLQCSRLHLLKSGCFQPRKATDGPSIIQCICLLSQWLQSQISRDSWVWEALWRWFGCLSRRSCCPWGLRSVWSRGCWRLSCRTDWSGSYSGLRTL